MVNYNVKQVICVRKDLNMRKGKMCAQASHAAMKVFFQLLTDPEIVYYNRDDQWKLTRYINYAKGSELEEYMFGAFAKIVVGVDSEEELLEIHRKAKEAGLLCSLIQDAGNTEFHGVPTYTACCVGPNKVDAVDLITSHLKLL